MPTKTGYPAPGTKEAKITSQKWLNKYGIDPYRYNKKTPITSTPEVVVNTTIPNPKILKTTARVAKDLVLPSAQPGDPEPYVYGHGAVKPMVIGADDSGEYLVLDLLLSVGEIDSIAGIPEVGWNHAIYMPDIGYQQVDNSSLYEHYTGTAGQSASPIMTALKGSYAAYANKAHSVISMQDGWNLNLLMFIYGRKVFDPRVSPEVRAFSQNPALVLADVLELCGFTVDNSSLADAADYCDELVGSLSPQHKRWEIFADIRTRNDLHYWTHTLAQYANCFVDYTGNGNIILTPDKPRSSNHTVTADDMLRGSCRVTRKSAREIPDAVTVSTSFFGGQRWDTTHGTSSGAGTVSQLDMPMWRRPWGAERKAEETYRKAQNDEVVEFVSFDDGLLRTIGDVGTITNSAYGLSSWAGILVENEPVDRGRWRRKYIEYDATNYVDSDSGEPTVNTTTLYNPYNPPPGPTPTLTAELVTSTSPNYYRIKIDFSPTTWAYLKDYKVNVYVDGVSPQTILVSEYVAKGSETGSPETITVYADLNDSPGFQMNINTSPQTVYRVDVYNRSLWTDQQGNEVLSATPGTATVTDPAEPMAFDNLNDVNAYLTRTPDSPWPFAFGDNDFTVAGWFQVPADFNSPEGPQASNIIGAFGGDVLISPEDPFSGWLIRNSFSGRVYFTIRQQGTTAITALTSSGVVQPNTWHFYIAEHDASANTITITADNGAATDTEATLSRHPDTVERDIKVGFWSTTYVASPETYRMRVDDTGIWTRLLTSGEKAELWNSGNGIKYADLSAGIKSGLISYWGFDETSGDRVDSHGSYDLSLVASSPELGTYAIAGKVQ